MARITLDSIREELAADNWKLLSPEYKNLDGDLVFECNEGHTVYSNWKRIRSRRECPICRDNQFKKDMKVAPKGKDVFRTLALDQATHITGYALFDNDFLIKFGTFETNLEDEIARDNKLKSWMLQMIEVWQPDRVLLEDIQYQDKIEGRTGNIVVYKALAHLQGILMEALFEKKIPYEIVHQATWRSSCGVKGKYRSDKKASARRLIKEWYDVNVTEDEADAICIGKHGTMHGGVRPKVIDWE